MVGSTRQIECADRFEISGSSRSYGRYQEASRGNVIPSTRKNRGSSSSAPPSLAISSLLLGPGRFSAYHIGRFRSVAGRLIWPASSPYGDTDRSRQLIKRFPAYCRARLDSPLLLWAYLFHRRLSDPHELPRLRRRSTTVVLQPSTPPSHPGDSPYYSSAPVPRGSARLTHTARPVPVLSMDAY